MRQPNCDAINNFGLCRRARIVANILSAVQQQHSVPLPTAVTLAQEMVAVVATTLPICDLVRSKDGRQHGTQCTTDNINELAVTSISQDCTTPPLSLPDIIFHFIKNIASQFEKQQKKKLIIKHQMEGMKTEQKSVEWKLVHCEEKNVCQSEAGK